MNNKILLKKSAVRDKVPAVSSLSYGELAIGYHHSYPTLWCLNTRDEVVQINPKASTSKRGMAEIATRTETLAGKDNIRFVTPKRLKQWGQDNIPDLIFDSGGADGVISLDNGTADLPDVAFINILDAGGAFIEPIDLDEN